MTRCRLRSGARESLAGLNPAACWPTGLTQQLPWYLTNRCSVENRNAEVQAGMQATRAPARPSRTPEKPQRTQISGLGVHSQRHRLACSFAYAGLASSSPHREKPRRCLTPSHRPRAPPPTGAVSALSNLLSDWRTREQTCGAALASSWRPRGGREGAEQRERGHAGRDGPAQRASADSAARASAHTAKTCT